jgi:hypothetical protein
MVWTEFIYLLLLDCFEIGQILCWDCMSKVAVFSYKRAMGEGVQECCVGHNGFVIFKSEISSFQDALAVMPDEDKVEFLNERKARVRRIASDSQARSREARDEKDSKKNEYSDQVSSMVRNHSWDEAVLMRIPRYVKIKKGKIKTVTPTALKSLETYLIKHYEDAQDFKHQTNALIKHVRERFMVLKSFPF